MGGENANDPTPGAPAAHWGTARPEDQPARTQVAGLRRLVVEARDRLGPAATPGAIAAELRAGGVDADPSEVARCLDGRY